MMTLLRHNESISRYELKPQKNKCCAQHPYWIISCVATSLCSGHGMKRTRGQLFSSSPSGSRKFMIDGISFGWGTIVDIAEYYRTKLFHETNLNDAAIEPIGRKAMNMKGKKSFTSSLLFDLF